MSSKKKKQVPKTTASMVAMSTDWVFADESISTSEEGVNEGVNEGVSVVVCNNDKNNIDNVMVFLHKFYYEGNHWLI